MLCVLSDCVFEELWLLNEAKSQIVPSSVKTATGRDEESFIHSSHYSMHWLVQRRLVGDVEEEIKVLSFHRGELELNGKKPMVSTIRPWSRMGIAIVWLRQ